MKLFSYFLAHKAFPTEITDCLYQLNVKYSGYLLFREDASYENSQNHKTILFSTPGFPESCISMKGYMPATQVVFSHVAKTFSHI